MTRRSLGVVPSLLAVLWAIPAQAQAPEPSRVRVFLDCNQCFADYLREEVDFVDYVRDREEADVHVIITQAATASRGREYTAAFIRPGTPDRTLRTVTTNSETDEVVRQQIANMLSIGLLGVVAEREVPRDLAVSVEAARQASTPAAGGDPWNNWVFSLRGSGSFDGEEFQRETRLSGSVSADRITPEWKITVGAEFEQENERFDLDEDEPVDVER